MVLVLSGLFHGVVYLVDGGPWEGPVSWRKPVVFGLSFGITLVTMTWFLTFRPPRNVTGWIVTSGARPGVGRRGVPHLDAEVAWGRVTLQREHGVRHVRALSMMGMLVALVAIVSVVITIRSFLRSEAPPSLAWAIRLGLVVMLVGQAVGVQMIAEGGNTFGAAGALKVPHAVTLHAVQVLPALALLLAVSDFPERMRLRVVALGTIGYGCLITATMVQTYAGRGPLDPEVARPPSPWSGSRCWAPAG